jgi:hypothetical protein
VREGVRGADDSQLLCVPYHLLQLWKVRRRRQGAVAEGHALAPVGLQLLVVSAADRFRVRAEAVVRKRTRHHLLRAWEENPVRSRLARRTILACTIYRARSRLCGAPTAELLPLLLLLLLLKGRLPPPPLPPAPAPAPPRCIAPTARSIAAEHEVAEIDRAAAAVIAPAPRAMHRPRPPRTGAHALKAKYRFMQNQAPGYSDDELLGTRHRDSDRD